MTKSQKLLEEYYTKFEPVEVSCTQDDEGTTIYIDTQRYLATSLKSSKPAFEDFTDPLKDLYRVTLADEEVMKWYTDGNTYSADDFERFVFMNTNLWKSNNKIAGFIITDKDNNGEVVGYEFFLSPNNEDRDVPLDTATIGYAFNKDYHRGGAKNLKDVGYINVGALVLKHGEILYQDKTPTPDGNFKQLYASVQPDNHRSSHLLEKLGFTYNHDFYEYGMDRNIYIKNYESDSLSGDLTGD